MYLLSLSSSLSPSGSHQCRMVSSGASSAASSIDPTKKKEKSMMRSMPHAIVLVAMVVSTALLVVVSTDTDTSCIFATSSSSSLSTTTSFLQSIITVADASNITLKLKADKRRIVDFGTFAYGGMYGGRLEITINDFYLHHEEDLFSGLAGGKIGFALDHVLSPSSARRARTAALKATKKAISTASTTPTAVSTISPPTSGAKSSSSGMVDVVVSASSPGDDLDDRSPPSSLDDDGGASATQQDDDVMGDDVILPSNKCFVDEPSMVPESRYLLKLEETLLAAAMNVVKAAREEAKKRKKGPSSSSEVLPSSPTLVSKKDDLAVIGSGEKDTLNKKGKKKAVGASSDITSSSSPRHSSRLTKELATLIPNQKERRQRLSEALRNSKIVFDISGRAPGYYALFFYNCKGGNSAVYPSPVTLRVKTSQYNILDEGVLGGGKFSFLPFGDTHLPAMYLFYCMVFIGCLVVWYQVVIGASSSSSQNHHVEGENKKRSTAPISTSSLPAMGRAKLIHKLMGALLLLKCITLFLNSVMLHHRKVTGQLSATIDYFFYSLQFIKGVFLFTIILLLGSGWSLLKPLLTERDRRILLLLIPLQLMVNVALVVLDETSEGNKYWGWWKDLLRLMDIGCCVCVMLPVAFSMRSLQQQSAVLEERQRVSSSSSAPPLAASTTTTVVAILPSPSSVGAQSDEQHNHLIHGNDNNEQDQQHQRHQQPNHLLIELSEEDAKMSEKASKKLTFFSTFYVATAAYMYLTRVLVDHIAASSSYQYTWFAPALAELITLAYYCYCGYAFRPVARQSWDDPQLQHHRAVVGGNRKVGGGHSSAGSAGVLNQKSSPPPLDSVFTAGSSSTLPAAASVVVDDMGSPLPQRPPQPSTTSAPIMANNKRHARNNNNNNQVSSMMMADEVEEISLR